MGVSMMVLDNPAIAPPDLGRSVMVLRMYTNDFTYTQKDTDVRTLKDARKEAIELMVGDETIIKVELWGIPLLGRPKKKFLLTRVDALCWYVDYREKFSDIPHTVRFHRRKDALKLYHDYLKQDILTSTNALTTQRKRAG